MSKSSWYVQPKPPNPFSPASSKLTQPLPQDLPFRQVKHEVATLDSQPSNESGGILIMVSGALLVEAEQRPMSYTQAFQLMPDGQGGYFVFNDVFRLVYPASA